MNVFLVLHYWSRISPEIDTTLFSIHETVCRGHSVTSVKAYKLAGRNSDSYAFCNVLNKYQKVSLKMSYSIESLSLNAVSPPDERRSI
ncbi:hypothetical protein [Amphritea sp.]|uniref:hypothetical protein n=1 Tax=Amphritea sp. TaxID=1872502 RepID=UPI0034550D6A